MVAVSAAACGERDEPLGELAESYPVTVRGGGDDSAVLKARPERIVAFDSGSAELVEALVGRGRLVGAPAGTVAGTTEVVGSTGRLLTDEAVRLEPDLVVATAGTDRVDVAKAVQRSGATLYLQPAATIEDVERATLELGFVVDEPVRARRLRTSISEKAARVDEALRAERPVTVFIDTGFLIPASDRTLLGSLVRRAKGRNVAGSKAGLGPIDGEELAKLDPDVYIALSDSETTLDMLERDPRLRNLTAVKEGRFVVLDTALVTRAGPRVADAYEAVAEALHPDAVGM